MLKKFLQFRLWIQLNVEKVSTIPFVNTAECWKSFYNSVCEYSWMLKKFLQFCLWIQLNVFFFFFFNPRQFCLWIQLNGGGGVNTIPLVNTPECWKSVYNSICEYSWMLKKFLQFCLWIQLNAEKVSTIHSSPLRGELIRNVACNKQVACRSDFI